MNVQYLAERKTFPKSVPLLQSKNATVSKMVKGYNIEIFYQGELVLFVPKLKNSVKKEKKNLTKNLQLKDKNSCCYRALCVDLIVWCNNVWWQPKRWKTEHLQCESAMIVKIYDSLCWLHNTQSGNTGDKFERNEKCDIVFDFCLGLKK